MSSALGDADSRPQDAIARFTTYEEYLDDQTTPMDLQYLQDEGLARKLVELGYRGSGETLKREEFEARKREIEANKFKSVQKATEVLASADIDLTGKPLLKALAEREELIRSGKLTSIIFIRDYNKKGQEISGYIDFAHRLKTEDCRQYFLGNKRLLPRPTDLSYFNWATNTSTSNPTPNFQVKADDEQGLLFKHKRDRKVVSVDPTAPSGDNSERVPIATSEYVQVAIYDHVTRRKG